MGFSLESFDDGLEVEAQVSPDFEQGFIAGRTEALAEALMHQRGLEDELVQVLSDTAFSFAEAQAHVLNNLAPLIDLVLTRILPETLSDSLAIMLRDAVLEAATEDAKHPMTLVVAPVQIEKLQAILALSGHTHLSITSDPELTAHAAFLSVAGNETVFDLDTVMARVSESLSALKTPSKRRSQIGT